jgi:DNA-binding XRE family transcriptional regulator
MSMTIKQARTDLLGWTQLQMADSLGICKRTLIRYEEVGAPVPILKLATRIIKDELKSRTEQLCKLTT